MMQIRSVSDLRNKYSEIENVVISTKSPVFLTKNGYGFLYKKKHNKGSKRMSQSSRATV